MRPGEFITSDHHFGHKNIIRYSERPFDTIAEMDEEFIWRWNNKVPSRGAVVYHLGDFSWGTRERTLEILKQLNGRKRLIRGNHEGIIRGGVAEQFDWVKDYYESRTPDGTTVVMSHYAFQVWNKGHYGSWMLHGHSHGSLGTPMWMRRMDVGVDTHPNYEPWSFEEIKYLMKDKNFRSQDHHREKAS